MKILFVTGIFPPDHGGPASYVPSIARGLQKYGNNIVAVITLSDSLSIDDSELPFPVVRIPRRRFRILRWIQTTLTVSRLARKADVIYANGLVCECVLAGKFITRRRVVVKVVGDLIWEKARNARSTELSLEGFQVAALPLAWRLLHKLQGFYTSLADVVITPSRYLSRIVCAWGVNGEKVHTVYNSVTPPATARRSHTRDCDIVTVARLVPWKGLRDLIKVTAELGLRLKIVGDGPLRKDLEATASVCGANVSFVGQVPYEHVVEEIRTGQLFVLNSSYEGMPHVVLEAKASGVAVLASAAGGTPETINHGKDGWLVPMDDPAALSAAIRRLLGDEQLREKLVTEGYRQIAESFSFGTQCKATESLLAHTCK